MRSRYIQNSILHLLEDNKLHTMKEICEKLEISRSTCIRHINDLSLHFNITTFVGRNNGGVQLNGVINPNIVLTKEELRVLNMALDLLNDTKPEIDLHIIEKLRKIFIKGANRNENKLQQTTN